MTERRIGLWGAVATLVGYVIGASIFVLPAELIPTTGAGIILSYVIAAIPAVFTCLAGAILGNAFPVSGASYVSVRDTVSPLAAFLGAWLIICAASLGTALVAYGLADYAAYFWPGIDPRVCAIGAVLAFILLNLTPATMTVVAQGAMVVLFAGVVLAFTVGGLATGDWSRVADMMPNGPGSVMLGAVAAYFSYAGLQVLIDIGGEIRDPARTIPRALALSFALVLALYVLFVLAVVLLTDDTSGTSATALIGRLAERHFGAAFGRAIVVSALLAAATSINGILFTQARDVRALAVDGRLPRALAGERSGIPRAAVLALGTLAVAATAVGGTIRDYAVLTAMCMMVVQTLLGVAVLRLPAHAPSAWSASSFRPAPAMLQFVGWGLVLVSLGFLAIVARQRPGSVILLAVVVAVGLATYRISRNADRRAQPRSALRPK